VLVRVGCLKIWKSITIIRLITSQRAKFL